MNVFKLNECYGLVYEFFVIVNVVHYVHYDEVMWVEYYAPIESYHTAMRRKTVIGW